MPIPSNILTKPAPEAAEALVGHLLVRRFDDGLELAARITETEAYFRETGRRVTLEYSLVKGENDQSGDAQRLGKIAARMHCHVNLIPVNPVSERSFRRPDRERIETFQRIVAREGVSVTIRREMGSDISGACGQLRRGYLENQGVDKKEG